LPYTTVGKLAYDRKKGRNLIAKGDKIPHSCEQKETEFILSPIYEKGILKQRFKRGY